MSDVYDVLSNIIDKVVLNDVEGNSSIWAIVPNDKLLEMYDKCEYIDERVKLCIRYDILKFTYCLIQYNIVFVPIDVVEYTVQKIEQFCLEQMKWAKFINTLNHIEPPTLWKTTRDSFESNENYCNCKHCEIVRRITNSPCLMSSTEYCVRTFENEIPDNKKPKLEELLDEHL